MAPGVRRVNGLSMAGVVMVFLVDAFIVLTRSSATGLTALWASYWDLHKLPWPHPVDGSLNIVDSKLNAGPRG